MRNRNLLFLTCLTLLAGVLITSCKSKAISDKSKVLVTIEPLRYFAEQMHKEVIELLEKMKDYPNFVLSSGCDTPPHTPLANIDAFFKALEEFNRQ